MSQDKVQALQDELMLANAADPYVHADYVAVEKKLLAVELAYYGPALAELAAGIRHDCGEVWPRVRVLETHRQELVGEMTYNATMAVHSSTDGMTEEYLRKIDADAKKLRAADPFLNVKELVDGILAEGIRAAAADFGIELA